MFSRNLLIGSQGQDQESLVSKDEKPKGVDLVTVFVPEITSENQIYSKSVTSILSSQDYQNYLPVYRPLTEPIYSPAGKARSNTCTVVLFVLLVICLCILVASPSRQNNVETTLNQRCASTLNQR